MNKEIKEKWVAALRSGEYKQSSNRLRDNKGFCCLGVLCDIYIKETNNAEWTNLYNVGDVTVKYDGFDFVESNERETALLPDKVWQWAGLSRKNPIIGNYSLSRLNDTGATFELIAGFIEQDL